MRVRAETLSKRAVFQYRRRDILAYASLRLYLRNQCTVRDRWIQQIAVGLELDKDYSNYNHIRQFKEMDDKGRVEFRDLYIPGPNEILAETALLAECSDAAHAFNPPSGAYSYRLATGTDTQGVFQYYFHGFRERHKLMAQACHDQEDAVVIYTDIRKFYPSVTIERAKDAWKAACTESGLSETYNELGLKLIENYKENSRNNPSLLIGPMFSHLIGNLILREIDLRMQEDAPGRYFRYVDDFVIVAPKQAALELEKVISGMLDDMDLGLHPDKRLKVSSTRWLEFENVFEDKETGVSWKTFIGGLKQLLLFKPESRDEMESKFREAGIRILPLDYSEVVQDSRFQHMIGALLKNPFHRIRMRNLSPEQIVSQGLQLRTLYARQLNEILSELQTSDAFGRKMRVPRLRFLLSRLGYLATVDQLKTISYAIEGVEEVAIFLGIFRALVQHDVSDLLRLGPQAAQMVAQPLRAASEPVNCSFPNCEKEVLQAYAILQLNGVPLRETSTLACDDMTVFCSGGKKVAELRQSPDLYFRELACLHGSAEPDLLKSCLDSAFDRDEFMVFDMLDYMYLAY